MKRRRRLEVRQLLDNLTSWAAFCAQVRSRSRNYPAATTPDWWRGSESGTLGNNLPWARSPPARPVASPFGSKRLLALSADERLVEQIRRGSEAAFEVAFERHGPGILGFCRHMLGSREEAEDAPSRSSRPRTATFSGPADGRSASSPGSTRSPVTAACPCCALVASTPRRTRKSRPWGWRSGSNDAPSAGAARRHSRAARRSACRPAALRGR